MSTKSIQTSENDLNLINPTWCQLSCIAWSVMWRYSVAALVIWGVYCALYSMEVGFIMGFSEFVHSLQASLASAGYAETLSSYSWSLFWWTVAKTIFGFLITCWVFSRMANLSYRNFKLVLKAPSAMVERTCPFRSEVYPVAWSFYWRLYVIMFIIALISFYFINPEMWLLNFPLLYIGYFAMTYFAIILVLKMILNHSKCKYSLLMMPK